MTFVMSRFLVDGNWTTSSHLPSFADESSNKNHIITVPECTNSSVSRVINGF